MKIIPAIDILGGKANILYQGDFEKATQVADDVVEIAKTFVNQGSELLHFIDLDGARDGGTVNGELILRAAKESGAKICQAGGGIRNLKDVQYYLDNGVEKIILGTKAVEDPLFLSDLVGKYADRIIVNADVKDMMISIKGRLKATSVELFTFINEMNKIGVKTLMVTDIKRDGAMTGIDGEFYKKVVEFSKSDILASGGIKDHEDLKTLEDAGVRGAVVGYALYQGKIMLEDEIK